MSGIPTVWSNALTDTSASDTIGIGSIRFEAPNKMYKWVQFSEDGSVTAAANQACYYEIAKYEL